MKISNIFRKCTVAQLFAVLLTFLISFSTARADQHVLSVKELHEAAVKTTEARTSHMADVERLLANDRVKQAMQTQRLDSSQIRKAVAVLSDDDLTKLAEKARTIESDLAAGGMELTNAQLTLLLMGFFLIILMAILILAFQ